MVSVTTNPQKGKFWNGSSYQEASRGFDGEWWAQIDGKWQKVGKNTVILEMKNPWDEINKSLDDRINRSNAWIQHYEDVKQKAEVSANAAKTIIATTLKPAYDNACFGLKKAKEKYAALFNRPGQNVQDLKPADQQLAKNYQEEITTQEDNKSVASSNISDKKSGIREDDSTYISACQAQMGEYLSIADIQNQKALAQHLEGMC